MSLSPASPLPGGPPGKVSFTKPWRSWKDQISVLQLRGLAIPNPAEAEAFLAHVNYYRFSGYCLAFETARHAFVPGTTFDQIRATYEFDWTLRDLLTEAVEIVEVDIRTAVAYHFGQQYGAFGHTNAHNFHITFTHPEWLSKLRQEASRSSEQFVKHFKKTYAEFPNLPVWIVTEVMSFGSLSLMFEGMLLSDQMTISRRYGLHHSVLESWLHHMVYVRNCCAHHARVWDRSAKIRPKTPSDPAWSAVSPPSNDRLFITLLMLRYMLRRCQAVATIGTQWKSRVEQHFASAPPAPNSLVHMGFPNNWTSHPLWV